MYRYNGIKLRFLTNPVRYCESKPVDSRISYIHSLNDRRHSRIAKRLAELAAKQYVLFYLIKTPNQRNSPNAFS